MEELNIGDIVYAVGESRDWWSEKAYTFGQIEEKRMSGKVVVRIQNHESDESYIGQRTLPLSPEYCSKKQSTKYIVKLK